MAKVNIERDVCYLVRDVKETSELQNIWVEFKDKYKIVPENVELQIGKEMDENEEYIFIKPLKDKSLINSLTNKKGRCIVAFREQLPDIRIRDSNINFHVYYKNKSQ